MKRVGVVSLYSFRPHQEHLRRLYQGFVDSPDWDVRLAICGGGFTGCYKRMVRPAWPGFVVCGICQVTSGLLSAEHVRLRPGADTEPPAPRHFDWIASSLCTKYRYEDPDKLDGVLELDEAKPLAAAAQQMYAAVRRWIDDEALDAVLCFNCRMDLSRAVLEATRDAGKVLVSLDRSWFGEGVQLTPHDSPHGLTMLAPFLKHYTAQPLTEAQFHKIYSLLAARMRGNLPGEFRQYNKDHEAHQWLAPEGKRRILFVPSSINEWVGHPDRAASWRHPTDAMDALLASGFLTADELLVRFHPGWTQKISYTDGADSIDFYRRWCERHGVAWIDSASRTSTGSLIAQCDLMIFCGSSAFFEAGMHCKPMVSLLPTPYDASGLVIPYLDPADLAGLSAIERPLSQDVFLTHFLRFAYAFHYRFMQYTDCLYSGAGMPQGDITRLEFFGALVDRNELLAYDPDTADSDVKEQELLAAAFPGLSEEGAS